MVKKAIYIFPKTASSNAVKSCTHIEYIILIHEKTCMSVFSFVEEHIICENHKQI